YFFAKKVSFWLCDGNYLIYFIGWAHNLSSADRAGFSKANAKNGYNLGFYFLGILVLAEAVNSLVDITTKLVYEKSNSTNFNDLSELSKGSGGYHCYSDCSQNLLVKCHVTLDVF